MKWRAGGLSRIARGAGGLLALTCSVEAPLPLVVRVAAFGTTGVYLLFTALTGSCFLSRLVSRLSKGGEAGR